MSLNSAFNETLLDVKACRYRKQDEYGTVQDPALNNTLVAKATGHPRWHYQAERALEMLARLWRLPPARQHEQRIEAAHALLMAETLARVDGD